MFDGRVARLTKTQSEFGMEFDSLADIIESFAQLVEEKDETGKKKRKQVFPRYHQLRTVRALPLRIDSKMKRLEVRGEIYITKSDSFLLEPTGGINTLQVTQY